MEIHLIQKICKDCRLPRLFCRKICGKSAVKCMTRFMKWLMLIYWITRCLKCICTFFFVYKIPGQKLGNFWHLWFSYVILIKNGLYFDRKRFINFHLRGDFWFFKHLKVIENRRLDLVQPCLDRLFRWLQFRWLNWNSLKGDQGKAAPNPIVYSQSS